MRQSPSNGVVLAQSYPAYTLEIVPRACPSRGDDRPADKIVQVTRDRKRFACSTNRSA
jgi:hypothetical protein